MLLPSRARTSNHLDLQPLPLAIGKGSPEITLMSNGPLPPLALEWAEAAQMGAKREVLLFQIWAALMGGPLNTWLLE